jgi:hypothetical protein
MRLIVSCMATFRTPRISLDINSYSIDTIWYRLRAFDLL